MFSNKTKIKIFCSIFLIFLLGIYLAIRLLILNFAIPQITRLIGVNYRKVSMNIFLNQLNLSDLLFSPTRGESIQVSTVKISYSLFPLLKKKLVIKDLSFFHPYGVSHTLLKKGGLRFDRTRTINNQERAKNIPIPYFKEIAINKLTICDGKLRFNHRLLLADFNVTLSAVIFQDSLKAEGEKLSFVISLDTLNLKIEEEKFLLRMRDGTFFLSDFHLKSPNSFLNFELKYNFSNRDFAFLIKDSYLDLAEVSSYKGKVFFSSQGHYQLGNIYGQANLSLKDGEIAQQKIRSTFCTLDFKERKIYYRLSGEIENTRIKTKGEFDLDALSYKVLLEIFGLEKFLSLKPPVKVEKGEIYLVGQGLEKIHFAGKSKIVTKVGLAQLHFEGDYFKGQLAFKKIAGEIGEKKFAIHGLLTREEVDVHYSFDSFPLAAFACLIKKDFRGILSGEGSLTYKNKKELGLKGSIAVRDFKYNIGGSVEDSLAFDNLELRGDLWFSESLSGEGFIKFVKAENILGLKLESLLFSLQKDAHFSLFCQYDSALSLNLKGKVISKRRDNFSVSVDHSIFYFKTDSFITTRSYYLTYKKGDFTLSDLSFLFSDGEANLILDFKKSEYLEIRADLKKINLEKLSALFFIKPQIAGTLDLYLHTQLNSETKNFNFFTLKIATKSFFLPEHELLLDSLIGYVNFDKDTIKVERFSFFNKESESKLTGFLIFDLDKNTVKEQNLRFDFANAPAELLFFIKEVLTLQSGFINGHLNISGDLKKPVFLGRIKISQGKLSLYYPEIILKNFSADLVLSNQDIILVQGLGYSQKGKLSGDGFLRLKNLSEVETLAYNINFTDIPMHYGQDFFGILSGQTSLHLTQKGILRILGAGEIKEGLITIPFGIKSPPPRTEPQDTLVEFDITLKGSRGIWLRNRNADVELSLDLNIKREKAFTIYTGLIKARQGYLYYLDRSLQLTEGEMIFENIPTFNPRLEFSAFLLTKPISYDGRKGRFKIILNLKGHLQNPEFKLQSDPPYLSEEDIISYLSLALTPQELKDAQEVDLFYNILSERLLSYFEREVSHRLRQYIGLDYFKIESGLFDKGGVKMAVGKYIGEKLYVNYTHSFGQEKQDVFRAEYYLNDNHQLVGERNEDGKTIMKYQFYFRF